MANDVIKEGTAQSADNVGVASLERLLEAEKLDALSGELADVIKAIEDRHKGKIVRTVVGDRPNQKTRVSLERDNGDRIAAQGATTIEAVGMLRTRLEKIDAGE